MDKPKCPLCQGRHFTTEPHIFKDDVKQAQNKPKGDPWPVTGKTTATFHLPTEIHTKLKRLAAERRTSMSGMIADWVESL